jgi:formylglycine-generating enzyme required for sulfatase activity
MEYAAKGGQQTHTLNSYIYSGSDIIDDVAWYSVPVRLIPYARTILSSPVSGPNRVVRGGGWTSLVTHCAVYARDGNHPSTYRNKDLGFRVVLGP